MHAHWWVELGLVPVVDRAMSRCVFRGGCELSTTLGTLSADGWGQVLVPKWRPLGKLMPMSVLWGVCHQCPCPHSDHSLAPAGDSPRPAGRFVSGSYEISALPWVPVQVKSCVHPPRMESLFPPVLWSSCTQALLAFKAKCSGGSFS